MDTGLASDVDLLLSVRSQVAAKFAACVVPRCGLKDQPVWRLCLVAGCAILFASRYKHGRCVVHHAEGGQVAPPVVFHCCRFYAYRNVFKALSQHVHCLQDRNRQVHALCGNTAATAVELFERRAEARLSSVLKRSSAHGARGRFRNKGNTCWLGSLLQALLSSDFVHTFLACHLPHACRQLNCPVCALVHSENQSRELQAQVDLEKLWRPLVEKSGLAWVEQQDPLHFCLYMCNAAGHFFTPLLGATLETTVIQTLPCGCNVELPPPHKFPLQSEFVVPLKVPDDPSAACDFSTLVDAMKHAPAENLTACPICDAKAGFEAVHEWKFGCVVLFGISRSPGNRRAVHLPMQVTLLQRSYEVRAVVCHRGDANSGHYLCFVRQRGSHLWTRYNDSEMPQRLPQSPQALLTHSAFVLYEESLSHEGLANFAMTAMPALIEAWLVFTIPMPIVLFESMSCILTLYMVIHAGVF